MLERGPRRLWTVEDEVRPTHQPFVKTNIKIEPDTDPEPQGDFVLLNANPEFLLEIPPEPSGNPDSERSPAAPPIVEIYAEESIFQNNSTEPRRLILFGPYIEVPIELTNDSDLENPLDLEKSNDEVIIEMPTNTEDYINHEVYSVNDEGQVSDSGPQTYSDIEILHDQDYETLTVTVTDGERDLVNEETDCHKPAPPSSIWSEDSDMSQDMDMMYDIDDLSDDEISDDQSGTSDVSSNTEDSQESQYSEDSEQGEVSEQDEPSAPGGLSLYMLIPAARENQTSGTETDHQEEDDIAVANEEIVENMSDEDDTEDSSSQNTEDEDQRGQDDDEEEADVQAEECMHFHLLVDYMQIDENGDILIGELVQHADVHVPAEDCPYTLNVTPGVPFRRVIVEALPPYDFPLPHGVQEPRNHWDNNF